MVFPLILSFLTIFHPSLVCGKGGATKGAAAGGAIATDFGGGNYTDGEMTVALIFLCTILVIFLAICSCQCYQKFVWEIVYDEGRKIPPGKCSQLIDLNKKAKKSSIDQMDGDWSLDPTIPVSQIPCAPYVRDMSAV